jgi:hypothetical protein
MDPSPYFAARFASRLALPYGGVGGHFAYGPDESKGRDPQGYTGAGRRAKGTPETHFGGRENNSRPPKQSLSGKRISSLRGRAGLEHGFGRGA